MNYPKLIAIGVYLNLAVMTALLYKTQQIKIEGLPVRGGYLRVTGNVDADIRNPVRSFRIEEPVRLAEPVRVINDKENKFLVSLEKNPIQVVEILNNTPPASPQNRASADQILPTAFRGPKDSNDTPGFFHSPYAPEKAPLDFRGTPSGTKVECLYTHKFFYIP